MRSRMLVAAVATAAALLAGCQPGVYEVDVRGPGVSGGGAITVEPGPTPPAPTTELPPPTEPPSPTTLPPPPTSTPPPVDPPPPLVEGDTAAARFGWGEPRWRDEFSGAGRPDPALWDLPAVGCWPGHAGKGRRCPENAIVGDGVVTLVGEPNGDTGWMQTRQSWYRGRWEARMRVVDTAGRDNEYHPVLLLWPAAEDFPCGGEVDFAETTATSDRIHFFLHYSCANQQTHGERALDPTEWHHYAVDWSAGCMIGYVDAVEFFRDCNTAHLPPRPMDLSIQLDYFPDPSPGPGETRMQVDWVRSYAP